MQQLAESIIGESIEQEKERVEGAPESVTEFTDGVKEGAEERVEAIAEATGADVTELLGEVTQEVEGYAEAKERILDADMNIGATAEEGAAGWNDKGNGNDIVIDHDAMDADASEDDYWQRVGEHELVHQKEQAGAYNASTLTIRDGDREETIDVIGDLTEGQATQVNERSDLTADYQQHQATWQRITGIVNESRLKAAMKTGDIVSLQEEIDAKALAA